MSTVPRFAPLLASVLLASASALTLPCTIHGFSVSDRGFVALLADRAGSRFFPLLVTGEADSETATSTEALTLLQMMGGIDLGGVGFPPELLQQRVAADGEEPELRRVCVLAKGGDSSGSRISAADPRRASPAVEADALTLELCVAFPAVDADELTTVRIDSAFEALALSMRYSASLDVQAKLLDTFGQTEMEIMRHYPKCYSQRDANLQRSAVTRRLAGLPPEPPTDDAVGLDVSAFDPASLSPAAQPAAVPGFNANGPGPDMLRKALEIARSKGDDAAAEKIEKLLAAEEARDETDAS